MTDARTYIRRISHELFSCFSALLGETTPSPEGEVRGSASVPAEAQAQAATLLMGGGQVCAPCRDKASRRGSASVPAEVQAQAATPLVGGGQVCASARDRAPHGQLGAGQGPSPGLGGGLHEVPLDDPG